MSWTRRGYRAGSALLLIAAGSHLVAHHRAFIAIDETDPARSAAIQAMQAYVVYAPLGTTLWTVLGGFSFAYAAMLALLGTTHWILGREAEPLALRRHALRITLVCGMATLLMFALHPVPQVLFVLAATTLLFAFAAWPRPLDR